MHGRELAAQLRAVKVTQRDLAMAVATGVQTVKKWCAPNHSAKPNEYQAEQIAEFLQRKRDTADAAKKAKDGEAKRYQQDVIAGFDALLQSEGYQAAVWNGREYKAIMELRKNKQTVQQVLNTARIMIAQHRQGVWPVANGFDFRALAQHYNHFASRAVRAAATPRRETRAARHRREQREKAERAASQ
jgi:hypothetical protein